MHLVTAIIKPHRLEDVTAALKGIDVNGITMSEVQGFGRQRGHTEVYRGSEYNVDFVPKTMIQILCESSAADKIADVIADSARTGKIGDGKIWITELSRVVRIRTGETGDDAL
jgi:nitrogen regulatory protein P-II 1